MLNIALFGPPGAGKGTQSKMIMEKHNLAYIATGDMLRNEIERKTEIGKKVKDIIENGRLAPDGIMVQLIEKAIKKHKDVNGFLFDGFPRTYVQAYIFDGLLQKMHTSLSCMLSLRVPNENLIKRLIERSTVSERKDDTKEIIQLRLEEYEKKTLPVAHYYKEKGIYYPIDGTGSVDQVFEQVTNAINHTLSKKLLNIVIYGYPGAGKGTQAKMLGEKFGLVYISIGKILRDERKNGTALGLEAQSYMDKGLMVPDETVIKVIEEKISMNPDANGFVFKGFPRTMIQTYIIEGFLQKLHSSVSCILDLNVSPLTSIRRLTERGKTEKRRSYDETVDSIIQRLEEYEEKTIPVKKYYQRQKKVISVNGVGTKEEVFERLCAHVEKASKGIR